MTTQPIFTGSWGTAPRLIQHAMHRGYLLLLAQFPKAQVRQPLNVSLVLDHSGSMQGPKMKATRAAAKRVVELLDPTDSVSVVAFDDYASVVVPAQMARDKRAICRAIDRIDDEGGTRMAKGMAAGLKELRTHAVAGRKSIMILLTDGQTYDEAECDVQADQLAAAGVTLMAFGLGDDWNTKLLNRLAAKTGGQADYIERPEEVEPFFAGVIKAAANTVAKDVQIRLTLVRGVEVVTVYRVTPLMANLGYAPVSHNVVNVSMGDVEGDVPCSIIVELNLHPKDPGTYRLAKAELLYTPVGAREPEVVELPCQLEYTTDPARQFVSAVVMNSVERVSAFKLQTRALSEAEAGNITGATQKLRGAATRLLQLGEVDAAADLQAQAASLDRQGANSNTLKALEYGGTRRLSMTELAM